MVSDIVVWFQEEGLDFLVLYMYKCSVIKVVFVSIEENYLIVDGCVTHWQLMCSHIQIMLTSTQKADNVLPTLDRHVAFGYTIRTRVIKTARNIGI